MTREEAKILLPIIKAFSDGKTLQYRVSPSIPRPDNRDISYLKEWFDLDEDKFYGFCCDGTINYRIKPETKYRPFKSQEECWQEMLEHQPFGWVKSKAKGYFHLIGLVQWSSEFEDVMITFATSEQLARSSRYISENYIFADGTPFGIKEVENAH